MNILLNWFKSKKREEEKQEELLSPAYVQTNTWETTEMVPLDIVEKTSVEARPYTSMKLVNDVLIVVLFGGEILHKFPATEEDFDKMMLAKTEMDVLEIINNKEVLLEKIKQKEEREKAIAFHSNLEKLGILPDFELRENSVYLVGTNRSLPELLVSEFLDVIENSDVDTLHSNEKYQSLKNFFLWCCLNPRAEVADQLYGFLKKNSFRLTKQGFFAALRNVVTVEVEGENKELVEFVSNSYNKIKAVWKKKPSDFSLYQNLEDNSYKLAKEQPYNEDGSSYLPIGNLDTLYRNLSEMKGNRYTDAYTGIFDIRVGRPVSMPMEECSWSLDDCARAGLICSPSI